MVEITGGSVSFERSVKVADYENKKLRLDLSFNTEEGKALSNEDVNAVIDRCMTFVQVKLGLQKAAPAAPATTPAAPGKTKADLEAAKRAALKAEEGNAKAEAPKTSRGRAVTPPVPAGDEIPMEDTKPAISTGDERKAPDDNLDDVMGLPAPEQPITDKELNEACARVNAKLKNPMAIKEVIFKYAKQIAGIPVDKRKEFLEKLNAL